MEPAIEDLGDPSSIFPWWLLQAAADPSSAGASSIYIQAILVVVGIALVAFFNSAEAGIISVNRVRMQYLAEQGNRAARVVNRILDQQEKFFATISVTVNALIIFASSVGTALAFNIWGEHGSVLFLAPLAMTLLVIILAEITPKTLGASAAERWSLLVARPLDFVMWLETYPLYLFTFLPRQLIRLMGGLRNEAPSVTEGELRMLIRRGRREGALDAFEAALLEKVFHFGDRQVQEVMVPRNEIIWVEQGTMVKDFLTMYAQNNHTRFPVFEGSTDHVIGVLYIKDVLVAQARGRLRDHASVTEHLRPAFFVPETKSVSSTFNEMQKNGYGLVLMVDEFGGISGLATLEMLLEVIVGDVREGGDLPEESYTAVDENTFQVDAGVSIADLNSELDLKLPEGDYQTLAGFILDRLGRIPAEGDTLEYQNLSLTVTAMSGVKIEVVKVERLNVKDAEQEAEVLP
ncbi:MAG: HlyC/CorC family transporter [SAR202 cluster bacterium]|nr:HlyC/CorC family transporter [SAR202 cluster bacterium]